MQTKHLFPFVAIACCLGVQAAVSGNEMTCSGEPNSPEHCTSWQLQTCHLFAECIYVSKILEGELHKLEQDSDKGGLIGSVT